MKAPFLCLGLLVSAAAATAGASNDGPDSGALSQIRHYEAANVDDGCGVEAVLFAEWFARQDFAQADPWTQTVYVRVRQPRAPDGSLPADIGHALTAFRLQGKYFLWDMNLGAVPFPYHGECTDLKKLTAATQSTYQRNFDLATARARRGENPYGCVRRDIATDDVVRWLFERVSSHRAAAVASYEFRGQRHRAVAFVFNGAIHVFAPGKGTISAQLTPNGGENLPAAFANMLGHLFGKGGTCRIERAT